MRKKWRIAAIIALIVFMLVLGYFIYWYITFYRKATMQGAQIPTAAGGINNPGNFRKSSVTWFGKITNPNADSGFEAFANIADGYRIIIKQYRTEYNEGAKSLLDIIGGVQSKNIHGYAPSSDGNDPQTYSKNIADALGIANTDDVGSYLYNDGAKSIMQAVAKQEQTSAWFAQYFNPADLDAAMELL